MQALLQLIPKVAMSLLAQLMTERFLKWLVIYMLELVVRRTKTEVDDKILAEARKAWDAED